MTTETVCPTMCPTKSLIRSNQFCVLRLGRRAFFPEKIMKRDSIASATTRPAYVAPAIDTVCVRTEQGFAVSTPFGEMQEFDDSSTPWEW